MESKDLGHYPHCRQCCLNLTKHSFHFKESPQLPGIWMLSKHLENIRANDENRMFLDPCKPRQSFATSSVRLRIKAKLLPTFASKKCPNMKSPFVRFQSLKNEISAWESPIRIWTFSAKQLTDWEILQCFSLLSAQIFLRHHLTSQSQLRVPSWQGFNVKEIPFKKNSQEEESLQHP